ncbi:MAG: hypothetical protein L0Y72_14040 [Gemmataceae bacterium]|nr:hypothetical protein [Gemmataceae bacterium]
MTQREKNLTWILLGIVGVGGGFFLVHQMFVKPMQDYNRQIATLQDEVDQKDLQLRTVKREKLTLEKWKLMSLPANPDKASAEYGAFLRDVFRNAGVTMENYSGPPAIELKPVGPQAKKAGHTPLTFTIRGKGTVSQIALALEKIQHTPLLHRVKSLTVDRPDAPGKDSREPNPRLGVHLVMEALIVHKADARGDHLQGPDPRAVLIDMVSALRGGPIGLGQLAYAAGPTSPLVAKKLVKETGSRNYADDLRGRNVFVGALQPPKEKPPEPDDGINVPEYIRLDTTSVTMKEAYFRNLVHRAPPIRVSSERKPYQTFRVWDEKQTKVFFWGMVLRIEQRDIYFQVRDKVYRMHIGQNFDEAMAKSLSQTEVQRLGLAELMSMEPEFLNPSEETRKGKTPGKKGGFPFGKMK